MVACAWRDGCYEGGHGVDDAFYARGRLADVWESIAKHGCLVSIPEVTRHKTSVFR